MPKISPFYNLIDSFSAEKLSAYAIEKKETLTRSYFLIKLDTKAVENILPAPYTLKEAHFSIDQVYANTHGYTPIHYTQCYTAPGQEDRILHGYLNLEGKFEYCQSTPLTLTPEQEEQLKSQISNAMPVLKRLFIEQKLHQTHLKKEADQLEKTLSNLSRGLEPKKTRQLYIQKAYQFIEKIEALNDYSLIQDSRALIVADRIKKLEAIQESLSSPLETKQTETELPTPSLSLPSSTAVTLSQKEKLTELYSVALAEFYITAEAFQAPNQTIQQLTQSINEIKDQLFLLYSFPDEIIIKKDQKKINRILAKVEAYEKTQYSSLTAFTLEGNVAAFKERWTLCSAHVNSDFYTLLVETLITIKPGPLQNQVLEIADYLSQHDENYRVFIAKLSQEKRYSFSKEFIPTLKADSETKKEFVNYHVSLLYKLYSEEKLNLFSAFLRHGACADTWGATSPEEKYPSLTLFYVVAMLGLPNYLGYLKKLLQHGVDPNAILTKQKLSDFNKTKLKSPILFKKIRAHIPQDFSNIDLSLVPSDNLTDIVELLSSRSGVEGLKIILPKASLGNLARYFSVLSEDKRTRKLFTTNDRYHTRYANTKEEAYNLVKNPIFKRLFISSIMYPCANNTLDDNQFLETVYERMEVIDRTLTQRLPLLSIQQFDSQYQELFKLGQTSLQEQSKEEFKEAYYSFLGCEMLLMKYATQSIDCPKKQRIFIQKYSPELYNMIILSLKKIDHDTSKFKQTNYQFLKDFYSQKWVTVGSVILDRPAPILTERAATPETNPNPNLETKQVVFHP